MDTQTQKQKEKEKKAGALGGLLGGGSAPAGGFGGLGTGSGGALASLLARVGLRGGLLATKAGVVGLVMAGTTVAGGLGWLGYRVFGPSGADRVGASYSLFAPRPKDAASAAASGAGGDQLAQGGASSLDELKAANGGSASGNPDQAAADKAAADKAAADKAAAQKAVADAAAQAAAKKAEANKGNVMGNAAAKLKSNMQVGQLSKMPGSGVSGGSSAMMATKAPGAAANSLSAFASQKSPGAAARASMARALGGGLGAGQQAAAANREMGTNYGGGGSQVYDGAGTSPIGGAAGQSVGGGGAGTPSAGTNPNGPTASNGGPSQFPTPPTPQGVNVTPWQNAVELATALLGIAALLLLFGKTVADKMGTYGVYIIAGVVAAIGIGVMALGHMIASGTYGQTYQGGIFTAAGAFLMVGGTAMMLGAMDVGGADAGPMLNIITMASGAAALGMAIMAYMKPMATYDQSSFPNGTPDVYQEAPDSGLRYAVLGDLHGSDSRDS